MSKMNKTFFNKYKKHIVSFFIAFVFVVIAALCMFYVNESKISSMKKIRQQQEEEILYQEKQRIKKEEEKKEKETRNMLKKRFSSNCLQEMAVQLVCWKETGLEKLEYKKEGKKILGIKIKEDITDVEFILYTVHGNARVGYKNVEFSRMDSGTKTIFFDIGNPEILSNETKFDESERRVLRDSNKVTSEVSNSPKLKEEVIYKKMEDKAKKFITSNSEIFSQTENRLRKELDILIKNLLGDDWNVELNKVSNNDETIYEEVI